MLFSVRQKILLSYLTLGLVAIFLGGGAWYAFKHVQDLNRVADQLGLAQRHLLEIFYYEQRFLEEEAQDSRYFRTGNSDALNERQHAHTRLDSLLDSVIVSYSATDLETERTLVALLKRLQAYDYQFGQLTALVKERGFRDFGIEGQMRDYAHALEDSELVDQRTLLTLRRHEKDYILRKDFVYVEKFEREMARLRTQYADAPMLDSLARGYRTSFMELVRTEQQLGTDTRTGLRAQVRLAGDGLIANIQQIRRQAEAQAAANRTGWYRTVTLMGLLAIGICVALSYWLANRLTRPIFRLRRDVHQMVENNFTPVPPVPTNLPSDEIGALTREFYHLADRLGTFVEEINEKHQQLETQNQKLWDYNAKLAQSEYELRRLNSVKDRFFSIVSHDLRSPLNTLSGFLSLLLSENQSLSVDDIREFARRMKEAVDRQTELLDNLLQWSFSQFNGVEFQPKTVPLAEVVDINLNLYVPVAQRKNIELRNLTDENTFVRADRNMLDYVLRNLLSNAIKFTYPGGQVSVEAQATEEYVTVSIVDNGIGMNEETLQGLFRPDVHHTTPGTAAEKGTGFGLMLCQEFVSRHDGQIRAESTPGEGTRVSFTVPVGHAVEVEPELVFST